VSDAVRDAARAWAERVRANREQVERIREVPDGDFYATVSTLFRAEPARPNDPVLGALLALARPDDTWLDIGAGAGRYALPLARQVREVIALDPSPSMLTGLRAGMAEHGIPNIRVVEGRWPADAAEAGGLVADVALIAHVGYDVEEIGPFIDAMEGAARRLCVAVLMERSPASAAEAAFEAIHGEARIALPALAEFLGLLLARGRLFEVTLTPSAPRRYPSRDDVRTVLRRQTWVGASGAKADALDRFVAALPEDADGVVIDPRPSRTGIVSWERGGH
jgi:precorrin-6B methylase 2